MDDYIIKKQPNAIIDLVNDSLNRTQKVLNLDKGADDKNAILKAAARVKQKAEEDLMKENEKKNGNKSLTNPAQRGIAKPTSSAARKGRMDVDGDDDDEEEASVSNAKPKGRKNTAGASSSTAKRGGGTGRVETPEHSDDDFDVGSPEEFQHPAGLSDHEDNDNSEANSEDEDGGGARASTARGKGAAANKAAKGKTAKSTPAAAVSKAKAPVGRGKAATATPKSPAKSSAATKKKSQAETAAKPTARRAAASKVNSHQISFLDFFFFLQNIKFLFACVCFYAGHQLRAKR